MKQPNNKVYLLISLRSLRLILKILMRLIAGVLVLNLGAILNHNQVIHTASLGLKKGANNGVISPCQNNMYLRSADGRLKSVTLSRESLWHIWRGWRWRKGRQRRGKMISSLVCSALAPLYKRGGYSLGLRLILIVKLCSRNTCMIFSSCIGVPLLKRRNSKPEEWKFRESWHKNPPMFTGPASSQKSSPSPKKLIPSPKKVDSSPWQW